MIFSEAVSEGLAKTVGKHASRLQGHDNGLVGPEAKMLCDTRRRRAQSDQRDITALMRRPEEDKRVPDLVLARYRVEKARATYTAFPTSP